MRWGHRTLLVGLTIAIFVILFGAIGPCVRTTTQDEVSFLSGWAVQLPKYYGKDYLTREEVRKACENAENSLRKDLTVLDEKIGFQLPPELRIPENNIYPIMAFRELRGKYLDKIRSKLGDTTSGDIPFPRMPTGQLGRDKINTSLTQIHLLDMLINTFHGLTFLNLSITQGRPSKNQRVRCTLVRAANEYMFLFNFTSSLEETLRWIDRLRNDDGFFYLREIEMIPSQSQPGLVEVRSTLVSVLIEQKKVLRFRALKLEDF